MRDPDYTYEIDRDSQALAWTKVGDAMAEFVAQVSGASMADARAYLGRTAEPPTLSDDDLAMRAWKLDLSGISKAGTHTDVGTWLVNGPFHPFWRWWIVSAVHLRDVEGAPPAKLRVEGATHEIMVISLKPDEEITPERLEGGDLPYLAAEMTHQVVGLRDDQAEYLLELMVRYIGSGRISPDSDYRSMWPEILDNTAEHLRYGTHPSHN